MRSNSGHWYVAVGAALISALALPPQCGAADVDVNVYITVGPPLPAVVFEEPPPLVVVPQTNIHYAPSVAGYDTYRLGDWWYLNRDGYWYRSRDHRGHFEPLEYEHIPREILSLPGEYHRYPAYHERRARKRAYNEGYRDATRGEAEYRDQGSSGRARAYDEGAYDGSHEGAGEKHKGKHRGKHEGKHTQHDQ